MFYNFLFWKRRIALLLASFASDVPLFGIKKLLSYCFLLFLLALRGVCVRFYWFKIFHRNACGWS